jgi:capsule biosynthesis phosphatase
MPKKKIICFDLDNVICFTNKKKEYHLSRPNDKAINEINKVYNKGFHVKIYTARGMKKYNGDLNKVKSAYHNLTKKQLKMWKVKYDELILGKTSYDFFVDDKAFGFKKNWFNNFDKIIKKI